MKVGDKVQHKHGGGDIKEVLCVHGENVWAHSKEYQYGTYRLHELVPYRPPVTVDCKVKNRWSGQTGKVIAIKDMSLCVGSDNDWLGLTIWPKDGVDVIE